MPKSGDVYNPITDSFGPPTAPPPYTKEGITFRQEQKSLGELNSLMEKQGRLPVKRLLFTALALGAGAVLCGGGIYVLEQLARVP